VRVLVVYRVLRGQQLALHFGTHEARKAINKCEAVKLAPLFCDAVLLALVATASQHYHYNTTTACYSI
jgi:hypothetical protein